MTHKSTDNKLDEMISTAQINSVKCSEKIERVIDLCSQGEDNDIGLFMNLNDLEVMNINFESLNDVIGLMKSRHALINAKLLDQDKDIKKLNNNLAKVEEIRMRSYDRLANVTHILGIVHEYYALIMDDKDNLSEEDTKDMVSDFICANTIASKVAYQGMRSLTKDEEELIKGMKKRLEQKNEIRAEQIRKRIIQMDIANEHK